MTRNKKRLSLAEDTSLIVDEVFTKGINIDKRIIYFSCFTSNEDSDNDISVRSVDLTIRLIHLLESKSNDPIELHMISGGGDAYALFALIDAIKSSPCIIKFYGRGLIASSASWVMATCDERYLYPNTRILIHDSSNGTINAPSKLTDKYIEDEENKVIQDILNEIYEKHSFAPKSFWSSIVKRDFWLSAEEAVELGLADQIIYPTKKEPVKNKILSSKTLAKFKKRIL